MHVHIGEDFMTPCRARSSRIAFVVLALTLAAAASAWAYPSRYTNQCTSCHSPSDPTCDGCHQHKGSLSTTQNQSEYYPGQTVQVTLRGGTEGGWIRATLYDQNNQVLDQRSTEFPALLTTLAPATPGNYTWRAAWYGNNNGSGHIERTVNLTVRVVQNPTDVPEELPAHKDGSWGRVRAWFRR